MNCWKRFCEWFEIRFGRHRDAFVYLLFTAIFSILPTISGFLLLTAFGKWTGDWSKLLGSGDLLIASSSLMATSVYVFRKSVGKPKFLKSVSALLAVLVIVFSTLFYSALALSSQGIIPADVKMLPGATIYASVVIYVVALLIGFHAFFTEQTPQSNLDVRNDQVRTLENDLDDLGDGQ